VALGPSIRYLPEHDRPVVEADRLDGRLVSIDIIVTPRERVKGDEVCRHGGTSGSGKDGDGTGILTVDGVRPRPLGGRREGVDARIRVQPGEEVVGRVHTGQAIPVEGAEGEVR